MFLNHSGQADLNRFYGLLLVGEIVNMSSLAGSFSGMDGISPNPSEAILTFIGMG
jgi:hypothetical protein